MKYASGSTLSTTSSGDRLELATALGATPHGLVDHPILFSGFLQRPDVVAAGLLAVADVAASRYADAGLGRRLANLDPVVTAGGDRLRFESFSACNGVYARLDLAGGAGGALGSGDVGFGTTNVDINLPLRTALARTGRSEMFHLAVGRDELRAATLAGTHVERKVRLLDRWVRGLAEVPAASASMSTVAELRAPALSRFVGSLPRVAPPGPRLHVVPSPAGWRTAAVEVPGSVPLPGASRLRGLERTLRLASRLTLHTTPGGTTAWVLDLPGAVFTLMLTPDPFRGFSGEGSLLTLLTGATARRDGEHLLAQLGWNPSIDAADLGRRTGLSSRAVASGLAYLAACGRLGHDLCAQSYFHRELPVDADRVLRRNPRLTAGQALADAGGVRRNGTGWSVPGTRRATYHVDLVGPRPRCECAWEREHAGARGPCKHVLAALLVRAGETRSA